ncbi:hypothetical protein H8D36_06730 [archaeon]|nr:hypothetical protein [archaeon]
MARKLTRGNITVAKRKGDKIHPYQVNVAGDYWQKHQTKSSAQAQAKKMRKVNR